MSCSRIRVLRVIARMNVGGPALQVTALAEDLDPDRFEQRLLTGSVDEGEKDFLDLRAGRVDATLVEGLGRSIKLGGDVRALMGIRQAIREFRPHIVHTHTAKAGTLGRAAALVTRVPATVHTFHGHLLHGYFSPFVTRAVIGIERVLARRTTHLVAVGSQVRDDLLAARIGQPGQYSVVAPGVRLPHGPDGAEARRALGLPEDALVVAYVARLTQVKRPDRFLEVAMLLNRQFGNRVHFLVAGEGDLFDSMRAQAASLTGQVHFLGWRPDVETVYSASDVAVLTSDNEGMPVSLIEAQMTGCPAVAPDVGSVADVVLDGTTGLVTAPNAPSIADAAARVLIDQAWRNQLAKQAAEHAQERFSRSRLVSDMAALYEGLAERGGFACVQR